MSNRIIVLSKARKQIVLLYLSTLLGVLLGIISSIINTRFLTPSDYGDVRYVQNIISFISSFLLFGYFLSGSRLLALSSDEGYSRRIRGTMVIILLIATLVLQVSTAICILFHHTQPAIANLFLISILVCAYPLFNNYINNTAQGDNHIGRLALSRLLPSLIYVPIAYLFYSRFGANSELMILLQWGISSIVCIFIILSARPSFSHLKPIIYVLNAENRTYGFQLYIGSLVMVASGYIAGITLSLFNADNTQVGYYTLATTVTAPLAMLPGIIGTTYFKEFAKMECIPKKVMTNTAAITIVSCIIFVFIIEKLVILLYSEKYAPVGNYAVWLAIGCCIHGYGDMINRYLGSHGQGKPIRNSSIINGVVKIAGYWVLVYFWNVWGAIVTTVLCDVIYTACIIYYYKKFLFKINTSKESLAIYN